jgi:bacteriocin-like protein
MEGAMTKAKQRSKGTAVETKNEPARGELSEQELDNVSGGDEAPKESLSLNFTKIMWNP